MDVKLFFDTIKKKNYRYRGIAFSTNTSSDLKKLNEELLKYLSPLEEWSSPGDFNSPQIPISRMDFCELIFRTPHPSGLLITHPEEWMFNWTDLDKGVFWTQLSQTYGLNDIYVIYKGTPLTTQEVSKYFKLQNLANSNISVWTSKYE